MPVVVDTKRTDISGFRGAAFIAPNRRELTAATGLVCETDAEARAAADVLIARIGAAVLLTRSEKGMSLFQAGTNQ